MATSRLVEITDKEISEIKINSVRSQKTQKTGVKIGKWEFTSGQQNFLTNQKALFSAIRTL